MDYKPVNLLNAIRASASAEYQERIPVATQENLAKVGTGILDYSSTRNEFVSALVDKIAFSIIKHKSYENPLKEFKSGNLDIGKDIEEIFVDLVKAQSFNPKLAETEVFKRVKPKILAAYHRVNREDFYKVTIQDTQLKKAFTSTANLNQLITNIIQSLYTSDSYDEFLLMKNAIHQYAKEGKIKLVEVPVVVDTQTARDAMVKIKKIANDMTFMTDKFNYAGVKTFSLKAEQHVLISTHFDAIVDVELLASAFNMNKADFESRKHVVDDFGGIENVQMAIVDKSFFEIRDSLMSMETQRNSQGLYTNHFLHHHQMISVSPFANAVLFVTSIPDITTLVINPATADAKPGESIQFTLTSPDSYAPVKAKWEVNSNKSTVLSNGLLIIGEDEDAATLTVTATSVYDSDVDVEAVVTII